MTATKTTRPRATADFKALLAFFGSEEQAIVAWNAKHPDNPIGDVAAPAAEFTPEVQRLIDAGFITVEQARAQGETPAAPAAPKPVTSKEIADALIEQNGLSPVRGRVYTTPELIEAQVRVLKTGKPEIVKFSGEHRTKAVAVFRTDAGDSVALQNLGEQRDA